LLSKQIERTRIKVSVATEAVLAFVDTYFEYDYFLVAPQPSNPWITDDITFWVLNESLVEVPTEKRVRRWGISFMELVNDPTGLIEFTNYLRKEYCHENIRFWQAVLDLKYGPTAEMKEKVNSIYE
ncbi:Regulator of G-protein signaling 9, partial [Armadillidium nasatum]